MLWYKGWRETQFRVLMTLGYMGLILALLYSARNTVPAPGVRGPLVGIVLFSNPTLVAVICAMLAGAGIVTQPSLNAGKGLHGSTLFTLSLPVSRFRLLAVRAGIGFLEGAGVIAVFCCGMWLVYPPLRTTVTAVELFEYGLALTACTAALYFLSVLLATFLDDQWRAWGTMIACMGLWSLPHFMPLPGFADLFHAIGEGSPLLAHSVPWAAMVFSLGLAAILFFAALKVAQSREY
jgi:ABC-2 type transport system permease protein